MSVTFCSRLEIERNRLVLGPSGLLRLSVIRFGGLLNNIYGEFDPGSGRTLAACLTHASRTVNFKLAWGDQWRTGE